MMFTILPEGNREHQSRQSCCALGVSTAARIAAPARRAAGCRFRARATRRARGTASAWPRKHAGPRSSSGLIKAINAGLADPKVKARIARNGAISSFPERWRTSPRFVASETEKWGQGGEIRQPQSGVISSAHLPRKRESRAICWEFSACRFWVPASAGDERRRASRHHHRTPLNRRDRCVPRRSWRSWASIESVAMGRASNRRSEIGSPVSLAIAVGAILRAAAGRLRSWRRACAGGRARAQFDGPVGFRRGDGRRGQDEFSLSACRWYERLLGPL